MVDRTTRHTSPNRAPTDGSYAVDARSVDVCLDDDGPFIDDETTQNHLFTARGRRRDETLQAARGITGLLSGFEGMISRMCAHHRRQTSVPAIACHRSSLSISAYANRSRVIGSMKIE